MKPEDLVTLREIAAMTERSLLTVRTWITRYPDFPEPWRKGAAGDPDLYLRARVLRWLKATGRVDA